MDIGTRNHLPVMLDRAVFDRCKAHLDLATHESAPLILATLRSGGVVAIDALKDFVGSSISAIDPDGSFVFVGSEAIEMITLTTVDAYRRRQDADERIEPEAIYHQLDEVAEGEAVAFERVAGHGTSEGVDSALAELLRLCSATRDRKIRAAYLAYEAAMRDENVAGEAGTVQ